MGCKEEAAAFAQVVCPKGFQVLAIDLPDHGQRRNRGEALTPWAAVPDIQAALTFAHTHWNTVSLRANSIGAYFAMLAAQAPERALLVSPILDMEKLILTMMEWAGVQRRSFSNRAKFPQASDRHCPGNIYAGYVSIRYTAGPARFISFTEVQTI